MSPHGLVLACLESGMPERSGLWRAGGHHTTRGFGGQQELKVAVENEPTVQGLAGAVGTASSRSTVGVAWRKAATPAGDRFGQARARIISSDGNRRSSDRLCSEIAVLVRLICFSLGKSVRRARPASVRP